ncbi:MAG TPA: shikimate dehydrogenase [Gallionella sp.]|nr:shikimate dehydrogenase [Gallionella sp.]
MTDKYAVIGNPIAHSKSPQIHRMFAEQTGQDISYEAIEAPLDNFEGMIRKLISQGYKGCNVTVPFKQRAFQLELPGITTIQPEEIDDVQAANTLIFSNNSITLKNTDGTGLVRDIRENQNIPLSHKRILLVGAGGAVQGVIHPILDTSPTLLIISNRTIERAVSLIKLIERRSKYKNIPVKALTFEQLGNEQFDVVINATSAGLSDSELPLPTSLFAPGALAYDMMYGRETPFMKFARANGAAVISDGLGMLVEQAAESFFIWRGVRPETAPVIAALRQS